MYQQSGNGLLFLPLWKAGCCTPRKGTVANARFHVSMLFSQWAYWEGVLNQYKSKEGYLQTQVGNPDGPDKPNKKQYDPRVWIRKAEESFKARLTESFVDLKCKDTL